MPPSPYYAAVVIYDALAIVG